MHSYKLRMWLAFILIIALCWLDYQFFTEGLKAHLMAPQKRRIMHLLLICCITATGYWGWYRHPMKWIKKLWVFLYFITIFLIGCIGLLQWQYQLFDHNVLDVIFGVRIFFCSPAPFFILYILGRLAGSISPTKQ